MGFRTEEGLDIFLIKFLEISEITFSKQIVNYFGLLWVLAAVCGEWGLLVFAAHRRLISWASPVVGHRLQGQQASAAVLHRLSCPVACGIFSDQGSNPCLLRWQADS